MRRQAQDFVCASCRHCAQQRQWLASQGRRYVQISATPQSAEPQRSLDARGGLATPSADARFEVLGTTSSLLSASISASQNLYTRKGTLVGFNGSPENAISTLSLLAPFRRVFTGIPFVYQRITSTTPYTALIGMKSSVSSLAVIHLDGRRDWMIAQRNALLAWTGSTLSLAPRVNTKMVKIPKHTYLERVGLLILEKSLAHWGNTLATGRGLLALSGKGLTHQIVLKTGDEYVVHPSNIVAYSVMEHAPQPYRFKSSSLQLQIPNPLTWLPDTRFWRSMRETATWRYLLRIAFVVRTWARRTIWGDRLFLHFQGPVTILVQSRGSSIRDVLTSQDVNAIAESPAGAVANTTASQSSALETQASTTPRPPQTPTKLNYATVDRGGTVKFDETKQ